LQPNQQQIDPKNRPPRPPKTVDIRLPGSRLVLLGSSQHRAPDQEKSPDLAPQEGKNWTVSGTKPYNLGKAAEDSGVLAWYIPEQRDGYGTVAGRLSSGPSGRFSTQKRLVARRNLQSRDRPE
jgi:hypothetical protein